jgi:hypothetical protein
MHPFLRYAYASLSTVSRLSILVESIFSTFHIPMVAWYDAPMKAKDHDPLAGVSERECDIMQRLLNMPPEHQKAAPKPTSVKGEAQRRRRAQERQQPTVANDGG